MHHKSVTLKVWLILLLLSFSLCYSQYGQKNRWVPGEVLVKFKPNEVKLTNGNESSKLENIDFKSTELKNALNNMDVESLEKVYPDAVENDTLRTTMDGVRIKVPDLSTLYIVKVIESLPMDTLLKRLNELPEVLYAEPNAYHQLDIEEPDDPFYENGNLWHLEQPSDEDIDAERAWGMSKGNGIKIAILDEGVLTTHDDLDGKISGGETTRGGPHGTMVSGMAAAETDNDLLTASIAWESDIIPYNTGLTTSGIISDLNSAVTAGADIVNLSLGSELFSESYRDAFLSAMANGVVAFASAGNAWGNLGTYPPFRNFPSSFSNLVIAVSATDDDGDYITNWNYGNHIDVCAPGYNVLTLDDDSDVDYAYVNGTSFSAPLTAGTAALMLEYNSNLIDRDFERILELSAEDKHTTGWDNRTGWGRINAGDALELAGDPDKVLQHLTASGGSSYNSTNSYWWLLGVPGSAPSGYYIGTRHEVRKTVTFGTRYGSAPEVWGRVSGTEGWYGTAGYGTNYCIPYCEPVPGTVTTTGATLRTYVYNVSLTNGQYSGWYPCQTSQVDFAYTVFGDVPDPVYVYISGPSELEYKEIGTWTANASDGYPPYSYQWYYKYDGTSTWSALGTSSTEILRMFTRGFTIKVVVTDDEDETDEDTHHVASGNAKLVGNGTKKLIPDEFSITQNYPNPFNPSTMIKFGLSKDSNVKLQIFNLQGQLVATLIDGALPAGYHSTIFDASAQPSGIYFYKIVAGDFRDIKRMLLVK